MKKLLVFICGLIMLFASFNLYADVTDDDFRFDYEIDDFDVDSSIQYYLYCEDYEVEQNKLEMSLAFLGLNISKYVGCYDEMDNLYTVSFTVFPELMVNEGSITLACNEVITEGLYVGLVAGLGIGFEREFGICYKISSNKCHVTKSGNGVGVALGATIMCVKHMEYGDL